MALRTDSMNKKVVDDTPKGEVRVNSEGKGCFYEFKKGRDDDILAKLKGEEIKKEVIEEVKKSKKKGKRK